jgi:hypothetical protein
LLRGEAVKVKVAKDAEFGAVVSGFVQGVEGQQMVALVTVNASAGTHGLEETVIADEHARHLVSDARTPLTPLSPLTSHLSPLTSHLSPLTCNEIQRPFIALVVRPVHDTAHRLGWSDWRRRHQGRSQASHYRWQAAQP